MIAKWAQEDVETLDNLLNNNKVHPSNSEHINLLKPEFYI